MPGPENLFERCNRFLLSPRARERADYWTLVIAIAAFFVHLTAIFLVDRGLIAAPLDSQLLSDPIAATYTPFSFILVYEVYLLIFYLPYSITVYVEKQLSRKKAATARLRTRMIHPSRSARDSSLGSRPA